MDNGVFHGVMQDSLAQVSNQGVWYTVSLSPNVPGPLSLIGPLIWFPNACS